MLNKVYLVSLYFFNVTTVKFKITYVVHILFLFGSADLEAKIF